MNEAILVINTGSSSIKFSLFSLMEVELIYHGEIDDIFGNPQFIVFDVQHNPIVRQEIKINGYESSLQAFFNWFETLSSQLILKAVGHRVVHGGKEFFLPTKITDEVLIKLAKLIPLAPLHQPHNLEGIRAISKIYPNLLQIGCFDTGFHRTQDKLSTLFALPRKYSNEGIIRYGFHGLSYEFISSVLPNYLGNEANGRIILCHLGNGASICAMRNRKSVATSMGLTALDGLMMGTRCGSIDPGVILYLLQEKKYTSEEITKLLYEQSGLLGVSGISSDIRELSSSKAPEALEAIDLFCFMAARELGALTIALRGCDAIVFTAGIGENSSLVRHKICDWLDWLGVKLDDNANEKNLNHISHHDSKVKILVIPTNEEYMIARHTTYFIDK